MSSRTERICRIGLALLGLAFLIYMIIVPGVDAVVSRFRDPGPGSRLVEDMTVSEHWRLRSTEVVVALWFFAVGASIGSFLNVVAFRLPRGESAIFRKSRCPTCGTSIAGSDNVPILGWLILSGRCRACDTAISPRYPIVEFATAAIFLLLYFVELISGGAILPNRPPNAFNGVVWVILYTKWDLIGFYVYHCCLFSTLLAWTLMHLDRNRIPGRAILAGMFMALVPPLIWPELLPVQALSTVPSAGGTSQWLAALTTACLGGLAGALLGAVIRATLFVQAERRSNLDASPDLSAALSLCGMMLGWQAVLTISILMLAIHGAHRFAWRPAPETARWPLLGDLLTAALLHHMVWRWVATN